MRTGLILDWRRTRQQVAQQKFALRVKARFNPFRDSAGCTIAMRWQRRLKSNGSEDQTPLLETRTRHGSHFLRASFAGRRISLPSKTEVLTSSNRNPFDAGATIWRTTACKGTLGISVCYTTRDGSRIVRKREVDIAPGRLCSPTSEWPVTGTKTG